MTRGVVFVGVGGCSSSGKTTLSRGVLNLLGSENKVDQAINLDWYMDPSRMPLVDPKTKERNWETPQGVRFDLLLEELRRLQEFLENQQEDSEACQFTLKAVQPKQVQLRIQKGTNTLSNKVYVVLEGFLLYYDKEIADLMTQRLWIETSFETALKRRLNRDMPTTKHNVEDRQAFEGWFKGHIWKHYQLYREQQLGYAKPMSKLDADWTVREQLEKAQHCLFPVDDDNKRSMSMSSDLDAACNEVQREIEESAVPDLTSTEDMQAMDLVRKAEQAEEDGDMDQARRLYQRVIRLSPTVAQFVGL